MPLTGGNEELGLRGRRKKFFFGYHFTSLFRATTVRRKIYPEENEKVSLPLPVGMRKEGASKHGMQEKWVVYGRNF